VLTVVLGLRSERCHLSHDRGDERVRALEDEINVQFVIQMPHFLLRDVWVDLDLNVRFTDEPEAREYVSELGLLPSSFRIVRRADRIV
jgi:hypothetical protein